RGFYIITYFFTYLKKYSSETNENIQTFSTKEKTYFGIKQLLIFLFGMIFFPISVFISIYSLIISGYYLKKIAEHKRNRMIKVLGKIIIVLTPIIGILWFSFIEVDYYSLGAVGLSLLAFLNYGLRVSKLSILEIMEKFTRRRLQKLPKIAQYIFLLILIALPTTLIVGTAIYTPQSKFTVMVPMRDDVKLATDVYFAPGSFGAPKPVILIRTPYGKSGWADDLYLPIYTIQDYHIVIQDLRGTHDSEGDNKFLLFTQSYLDGVDTIDWMLAQSWCNGKIASAGISALCLNEYYYAGMGPDGLKAQQLWFGTPELFDHAIFQGSYHKSSVETWIKDVAPNNWRYQIDTIFDYIPKNEVLYNSTSLSIPLGPHYSNVSVYGIHVGGWYDQFLQGTLDGYIGYDDFGDTQARGHQKLIMGPWTHGAIYGGQQGELFYPENSDGFNMILNWDTEILDDALLGIPADWNGARVAYYLMGDVDAPSSKYNYWRYAYDWPLDHKDDVWYLTHDGGLTNTSVGINNNISFLFDPRFPVPNLGGQNQPFDLAGPMDQRSIENRSDVLLFETPILIDPVETVGRIYGNLFISSNCTDTDFTVKISDVYPDGRSMLVTDGSLTVRFRDNYTSELLMSGDQKDVYELWVDCWSTAYYFAPGHKIRVAISSSNYPRFGTNPNTGAPLAYDYLTKYIANNTLLVGPGYESAIILPRLVNMSDTHVSF
ncbi:MAG: CocE/NonD family hydrolase, partial [Promethearchaeota archaeon]